MPHTQTTIPLLLSFSLAAAIAHAQEDRPRASVFDRPLVDVELRGDALSAIEDGTPGIRTEEKPALARFFAHVAQADRSTRDQAARRLLSKRRAVGNEASFSLAADLIAHPQEYRGRPIRVWGNVRGLVHRPAADGSPEHYEAALVPSPSAEEMPKESILLFTDLPEGLSPGGEMNVPVLASAWLFKLAAEVPETADGAKNGEAAAGGDQSERSEQEACSVPMFVVDELTAFGTTLGESILRNVKPRTFHILDDERDAYLQSLLQARLVDPAALRQAAEDFLHQRIAARRPGMPPEEYESFVDAYQNFDAWRGQPVTFRGHARRIVEMEVEPNEYGIDSIYEVWLYTPDSRGIPIVVACTSIPEGIPTGPDLIPPVETVEVTGFVFKKTAYESRETPPVEVGADGPARRKFPIVLFVVAGPMHWMPPPPPDGTSAIWWVMGPIAAVGLVAIVWIALRARREERRFREGRATTLGEEPPDLSSLT